MPTRLHIASGDKIQVEAEPPEVRAHLAADLANGSPFTEFEVSPGKTVWVAAAEVTHFEIVAAVGAADSFRNRRSTDFVERLVG